MSTGQSYGTIVSIKVTSYQINLCQADQKLHICAIIYVCVYIRVYLCVYAMYYMIIHICVSYMVSMLHIYVYTYIYPIYILCHGILFNKTGNKFLPLQLTHYLISREPFDSLGPQFPHLKSKVIRSHTLKHILALIACYYLDNEETHWVEEERLFNCGFLLSRKGSGQLSL